jgi:hypothetical protein
MAVTISGPYDQFVDVAEKKTPGCKGGEYLHYFVVSCHCHGFLDESLIQSRTSIRKGRQSNPKHARSKPSPSAGRQNYCSDHQTIEKTGLSTCAVCILALGYIYVSKI